MFRSSAVVLAFLLALAGAVSGADAGELYSGRMQILVTSGAACAGVPAATDVTLTIARDGEGVTGFFTGAGVTIGSFSGSDLKQLDVRYPNSEEVRAAGHRIAIGISGSHMTAELRDRHVEATAQECNFDLARLELTRQSSGDATAAAGQMAGQFDAQLTRSRALETVQKSGYEAALPHFEKALELADRFHGREKGEVTSYIVGLATAYVWLNRTDAFNRLFDERIRQTGDESLLYIFSVYRAQSLMTSGRTAMGREDYDTALKELTYAFDLQPRNREVVSLAMTAYLRSGRFDDALTFLGKAGTSTRHDAEQKDINAAMALILYKKALKEERGGNGAEAEQSLKRSMDLDPGVHTLIALARLRHKGGSLDTAESLLDEGLERFRDAASQQQLNDARERMIRTEIILKKLRDTGEQN